MRPILIHYAAQPGKAACGADAQCTTAHQAAVSCANCRRTGCFIRGDLFDDFTIETDEEVVDV